MIGLVGLLLGGVAQAGTVDVGGYFRVMARPDVQGGNGRLGHWNLYGRLMNEGAYGMLDLRYDLIEPVPGSTDPWTSVHARIEGGSIANADPGNGDLGLFRLSQVYVKTGNVALQNVVWQVGTLEYFYGDLGLYDMRPATIFFDTVGLSAHLQTERLELLLGAGDSGYRMYGGDYSSVPTLGGAARLKLGALELGVGGELKLEPGVLGNRNAPYQTPDIGYEDWIREEVAQSYLEEFGEELAGFFPDPEPRRASSGKVVGYLGFGGGPLVWNNLFVSLQRLHPQKKTTEQLLGDPVDIWVHDFTDQRTALTLGNEMQLRLVPDRLDLAVAALYGDVRDGDNDIAPSDFDRTYASAVARAQAYVTPTVHVLLESSVAREWSRNGRIYREYADSIFANTDGRPDARGLELGDTDTRRTWQGKGGVVLNPLGPGIFARPSVRILYGVQLSNENNAFGNAFVQTLDQFDDFDTVEQHVHHLASLEAEVWF
ncbi:MAG: hypothetical protein KTR31_26345 [Myxococcales bacterium]|nr:hypothetical protein [Myxococcales bacterium]